METIGIADTEKAQRRDGEQAFDQAGEQGHFVLVRGAIGGEEGAAAVGCNGIVAATELGEIINRGADARDQLLYLLRFPSDRERVGCGAHLYG